MVKSLNKKNGNLRGVDGAVWQSDDPFGTIKDVSIQGWTVRLGKGHGFTLVFEDGERKYEITLSEGAVERILYDIDDAHYE